MQRDLLFSAHIKVDQRHPRQKGAGVVIQQSELKKSSSASIVQQSDLNFICIVHNAQKNSIGDIHADDLYKFLVFFNGFTGPDMVQQTDLQSVTLFAVIFKSDGNAVILICRHTDEKRIQLKSEIFLQRISNKGKGEECGSLLDQKKPQSQEHMCFFIHKFFAAVQSDIDLQRRKLPAGNKAGIIEITGKKP